MMGGTPGVKVMATAPVRPSAGSCITSGACNKRRAPCCQLDVSDHEELLPPLLWGPGSLGQLVPPPFCVEPLIKTCVNSPRRLETYSAVSFSFTPKNICVVLERSVCP